MIPIEEDTQSIRKASQSTPLPNFLIVGAPKTGTTSLYHYLKQHPQIYMSPIKEPCYFSSEMRPENYHESEKARVALRVKELQSHLREAKSGCPPFALVTDWGDYQLLFRNVQAERAIGEASVFYLWSVSAPGNIHSRLPLTRIVMILRDPVERAFSHYLHCLSGGYIKSSFREHIDRCIRGTGSKLGPIHPFLEFGLYYQQVKRYLDLFPRNNIRIYWYEEAWRDPILLLADLFKFLAVSRFDVNTSRKHLERRGANIYYLLKNHALGERIVKLLPRKLRSYAKPLVSHLAPTAKLTPKDRKYLVDYYRNDIEKLALLMHRDLTAWLSY